MQYQNSSDSATIPTRRSPPPPLVRTQSTWLNLDPPSFSTFALLLLITYTMMGASIFFELEQAEELIRIDKQIIEHSTNREIFINELQNSICGNRTDETTSLLCDEEQLLILVKKYEQLLGVKAMIKPKWTHAGALFYSVSLFTTIGYGNIVCSTMAGRIMSMLYALVGIPLTFIVLSNVGNTVDYQIHVLRRHIVEKITGNPEKFSTSLPLFIAVTLMIILLFGLAGILAAVPSTNLDYFEALYFCFMSITTIGLGDVMPNTAWALCTVIPITFGLSLFPMIVNALNERYNNKMDEVQRLIPQYGTELKDRIKARSKQSIAMLYGPSRDPKISNSVSPVQEGKHITSFGELESPSEDQENEMHSENSEQK